MKLKLLSLLFLFYCAQCIAQYKQMLHKPYKDKIEAIDRLYRNTINKGQKDTLYVKRFAQEMKQWALTNEDKELALEATLLKAYSNWFLNGYRNPELVQNLISVAQIAKNEQVPHIEVRAIKVIATHYWKIKNYEKSFEWLLRSAKILEKMKPESFPNMAEHLNFIGRCYYYFTDYTTALIYYEKSSNIKKTVFNEVAVLEAQNTLGLCYQKLGKLKRAEQYFLKVIHDTSQYKNFIWKGIATGNLGYNYYLKGEYEEAVPLFKEDLQNALTIKEYRLAAGSAIPLADIYLTQNKLTEAKQKIEEAKTYIQQSGQTDQLRKLYPIMSKWYAFNNDSAMSATYVDSAMLAVNAYNEEYNSLKLLRAKQKVEAKDRQIEIGNLKNESRIKISQRNFIIALIGLLLIISLLTYWFRIKYLLKEQQVKKLILEKTEKSLFQAKNQLQNLKEKVHKENKVINRLQQENQTKDNQKMVNELKNGIILTEEDWNNYQRLFEQVYPNYLFTLKTTYASLTPSELRCLCLEKLELSNKEMALVLGISANSIMVTKHRIRKKLVLKTQKELNQLVREIN